MVTQVTSTLSGRTERLELVAVRYDHLRESRPIRMLLAVQEGAATLDM
jgi:hypothetical protein